MQDCDINLFLSMVQVLPQIFILMLRKCLSWTAGPGWGTWGIVCVELSRDDCIII